MNKKLTCIICPRGCQLEIDENNNVFFNFCIRGKTYALNEINDPKRTITSIMKVSNRDDTFVSVKCVPEIKKELIFDLMKEINQKSVKAPIKRGDILIENVLDSGVNIIATKDIA